MKSFRVFQFAEGCKRFRTETMSAPDAKVVLDKGEIAFTTLKVKEKQEAI